MWDAGLQPERTRLAWQRTSLALLTAGLVIARFVGHHGIAAGVTIAAVSCALAGGIGILSTRRYQSAQRLLADDRPLQDGTVNLLMTLAFLVVGAGATVYVLINR